MTSSQELHFHDLPGGDLLTQGLADWQLGVESIPALLAQIGAPRLRQLAIEIPERDPGAALPEHRLYERLAAEHGATPTAGITP